MSSSLLPPPSGAIEGCRGTDARSDISLADASLLPFVFAGLTRVSIKPAGKIPCEGDGLPGTGDAVLRTAAPGNDEGAASAISSRLIIAPSRAPSRGPARVALHAGAVAHQSEV